MAAQTGNYVCDNSSLANFKNWAMAISAAFSAFGWTQTADSGQVNWSSLASVPSNAYVYEVWKANDAQAATMPIFVKMEYGYSSTAPTIRATVGTNSNGSGTITGNVVNSAPWTLNYCNLTGYCFDWVNNGSTLFPCFFSGDAGEMRMYLWQCTTQTMGAFFAIERSKDASGNKTDEFVAVMATNGITSTGATWNHAFQIISATALGNYEQGLPCIGLTANTGAWGGTVAALPIFPILGKVGNPFLGVMNCCAADVGDGSIVTVSNLYGGTHTFVVVKGNGGGDAGHSVFFGQRNYAGSAMAGLMRYE